MARIPSTWCVLKKVSEGLLLHNESYIVFANRGAIASHLSVRSPDAGALM